MYMKMNRIWFAGDMVTLLLFVVQLCSSSDDLFDIMEDLNLLRKPTSKVDLSNSVFASLDSYHENATVASEGKYPWIAKVVHSKTRDVPYMCTAACVLDSIFITAARCIFRLKVQHTTVIYRSKRLPVRAFVVPTNQTIQLFDDIGFIVTEKTPGVTFNASRLYSQNEVKRTDETFTWFAKMNLSGPFKVVGYVMDKKRLKLPDTPHVLRELPVVVNIDLCWNILTNGKKNGFHVPCYYSCTVKDFVKAPEKCFGYLGVEGAAIVHDRTKKVLGLATWGPQYIHHELPVGFSVVNSKAFQEDFGCAKKIRNVKPRKGSYQDVC